MKLFVAPRGQGKGLVANVKENRCGYVLRNWDCSFGGCVDKGDCSHCSHTLWGCGSTRVALSYIGTCELKALVNIKSVVTDQTNIKPSRLQPIPLSPFPNPYRHSLTPNQTKPQQTKKCAPGTTSSTPAATASTSANGSSATPTAPKSASAPSCRRPRRPAGSSVFAAWLRRGRRLRRRRPIRRRWGRFGGRRGGIWPSVRAEGGGRLGGDKYDLWWLSTMTVRDSRPCATRDYVRLKDC